MKVVVPFRDPVDSLLEFFYMYNLVIEHPTALYSCWEKLKSLFQYLSSLPHHFLYCYLSSWPYVPSGPKRNDDDDDDDDVIV